MIMSGVYDRVCVSVWMPQEGREFFHCNLEALNLDLWSLFQMKLKSQPGTGRLEQ